MSFRETAIVALSIGLVSWYRLLYRLPAPLGRHALLYRSLRAFAGPASESSPARRARAARLEALFLRALGWAPAAGAGCVPRSVALARLLRLRGLAAELRVGMRRAAVGFTGHAWVMHDRAVIGQPAEHVGSFAPLERPGRCGAAGARRAA
jgi:hypothetical protein